MRHLLGGGAYLRPGASYRKYGIREILKNMNEDTPIPIVINNDTDIFFVIIFFSWVPYVWMKVENATSNDSL